MTEPPTLPTAQPAASPSTIRQECLRHLTISVMAVLVGLITAELGGTLRVILIPLALLIGLRSIRRVVAGVTVLQQVQPVRTGMIRVHSAVGWVFAGLILWSMGFGEALLPRLPFSPTVVFGALGAAALAFVVWEIVTPREDAATGPEGKAQAGGS
jgi:hypothetical protein